MQNDIAAELTRPVWHRAPRYGARLLSGAPLDMVKIGAAALMIVDHVNDLLLDDRYFTMYLAGRGAFPLFCWASAAALCRARGDRAVFRQAMLLLFFAVISELASQVARPQYTVLNVLFTLSLGVALAPAVLRLRAAPRALVYALAAGFMGFAGAFEFGLAGALLPAALAGAVMGARLDMAAAVLLAALGNFRGFWGGWPPPLTTAEIMLAATVWPLFVLWLSGQMAAGEQRLLPRYALHVFYPAHMLVLAGLRLLFA